MPDEKTDYSYLIGILVSLVGHLFLAALAIVVLENRAASAARMPEVFSVTLEGGERLGGFTQVPEDGAESKAPKLTQTPSGQPKAPPAPEPEPEPEPEPVAPPEPEEPAVEQKQVEKQQAPEEVLEKMEQPAVLEDLQKKKQEEERRRLEEEKKKQEQEKKRQAEEQKKREEERKKKEAEKKKKAEEARKREEAERKRKAEEQKKREEAERKRKAEEERKRALQEKREREQRLSAAIDRYRNKSDYTGESANAGGDGFGAARVGGSGMGGGVLASAEKIAYANQLQQHVKSGWRWLPGSKRLRALVVVRILPSGQVQDIRIENSSGNANFDDSVVRAVRKASPVPAPPEKLYSEFSTVRFWFDSHEQ